MQLSDIFGLLGGLALFLYGMQMMSDGLEAAAGDKMKSILERLTSNRILGVLVGAGITAVIQSSSATTVMVVGFVNAGIMTLQQAVWIIMGANIGTTVTGILVSLDIGAIAPLLAFIGVVLIVFIKDQKLQHIGGIMAGLGVLFIGMDMMSASMSPLRGSQLFIDLVSNFSNPILGIMFGAVFTAIIQSSSAAVGILQTLADTGIIPFSGAVFVLFGTNIGTCITAVLAAIGTNRNARRTTIIHLMFNIIGTIFFTFLVFAFPITNLIESVVSGPMAQIAAMHTTFNIITTCLLLPFGTLMAAAARKILPDKAEELEVGHSLAYLTPLDNLGEHHLGTAAIITSSLSGELRRMAVMVRDNITASFQAVLNTSSADLASVEDTEEYIDYLNKEISKYISSTMGLELNDDVSAHISSYFKICGDLERIGDHAMNICEYTKRLESLNISFSENAKSEIIQMRDMSVSALENLMTLGTLSYDDLEKVAMTEQKMDDMTVLFRKNQISRMRSGICSDEACVLYSEMLTDFERIGDHILNVAEELAGRTVLQHN